MDFSNPLTLAIGVFLLCVFVTGFLKFFSDPATNPPEETYRLQFVFLIISSVFYAASLLVNSISKDQEDIAEQREQARVGPDAKVATAEMGNTVEPKMHTDIEVYLIFYRIMLTALVALAAAAVFLLATASRRADERADRVQAGMIRTLEEALNTLVLIRQMIDQGRQLRAGQMRSESEEGQSKSFPAEHEKDVVATTGTQETEKE